MMTRVAPLGVQRLCTTVPPSTAAMRSEAAAAIFTPKRPCEMSKRSVMIPSTGFASSIASRILRRESLPRPASE